MRYFSREKDFPHLKNANRFKVRGWETTFMDAKQRIMWVDYAKCFGIIAVVCGHAINGVGGHALDVAYNAIYWWHMPLFFMMGGFFLKKINLDAAGWKYLLKKRIQPLLTAYFLNGTILILLSHFFRQQSWDYILLYFVRLFYGGSTLNNYLSVFWYMTAYALAIFLTMLLLACIKKAVWQFVIALGAFFLGIALQDINFFGQDSFPWDAQVSLLAVFWMLLGYYFFRIFPKINWSYHLLGALLGLALFIFLIYLYAQGRLDFVLWLKSANVHSGWQALFIPPVLCLVVFSGCELLDHLGGFTPFRFIGQNTDVIMFYHRAAFDITTVAAVTDNWYFRIIIGLAAPIILAWALGQIKDSAWWNRLTVRS